MGCITEISTDNLKSDILGGQLCHCVPVDGVLSYSSAQPHWSPLVLVLLVFLVSFNVMPDVCVLSCDSIKRRLGKDHSTGLVGCIPFYL